MVLNKHRLQRNVEDLLIFVSQVKHERSLALVASDVIRCFVFQLGLDIL